MLGSVSLTYEEHYVYCEVLTSRRGGLHVTHFSSLAVCLIDALHGQHMINAWVQANLVKQGYPRFFCGVI